MVGEPIAFGIGFVVLVLVAYTGAFADSLVTVTHEGGHMLTLLLTGRGLEKFTLEETSEAMNGETVPAEEGGWLSNVIVFFSGYPVPPLGGAYVIADGNSWGVLWIGIVLLAAALLVAAGTTALVITAAAWPASSGPRSPVARPSRPRWRSGWCGCCSWAAGGGPSPIAVAPMGRTCRN